MAVRHAEHQQRRDAGDGNQADIADTTDLRSRNDLAIPSNGQRSPRTANTYENSPAYCMPSDVSERAQLIGDPTDDHVTRRTAAASPSGCCEQLRHPVIESQPAKYKNHSSTTKRVNRRRQMRVRLANERPAGIDRCVDRQRRQNVAYGVFGLKIGLSSSAVPSVVRMDRRRRSHSSGAPRSPTE